MAGTNKMNQGGKKVKSETLKPWSSVGLGGVALLSLAACCATPKAPPPPAEASQKIFATPELAVDALIAASRNDNPSMVLKILGPEAQDLIHSGDPVEDANGRKNFVAAYDRAHHIETEDSDKAVLVIGERGWPMPIPMVHVIGGWQWDTESGAQEILNRRIGRNELMVAAVCRTYVEAQQDFSTRHSMADGHSEYAQKFISGKSRHDGLYWPAAAGERESPLGPLVAEARDDGYTAGKGHEQRPYYGYIFKILKRQGPDASGGAKSYVEHGRMTGGFALLAHPAKYGDSGIMTFMVNQDGIVYQKNLGPYTEQIVSGFTDYDPDESWDITSEVDEGYRP